MSEEQETKLKYGKLTANYLEAIPWDRGVVEIIGPHKTRGEVHGKSLILEALTIIYLDTGWLKIIQNNIHMGI